VLLGSAIILLKSYETMIFFGPALALIGLWRTFTGGEKLWQRAVLFISSVLLCMATWVSLQGLLHPDQGPNLADFKGGLLNQFLFPGWPLGWTFFWVLLMLVGLVPDLRRELTRPVAVLFLAVLVLLWGVWPLLAPSNLEPAKQFGARSLELLVPIALLPVALLLSYRDGWLRSHKRWIVNTSAALLIAQSLWQIAATEQWRGYLNVLRGMIAANTGIINLAETPYGKNASVGNQATSFLWLPDTRDLSIEISPPKIKSIVNPAVGMREIDEQFKPENLPSLGRYGVDYSEYIKAVAKK